MAAVFVIFSKSAGLIAPEEYIFPLVRREALSEVSEALTPTRDHCTGEKNAAQHSCHRH